MAIMDRTQPGDQPYDSAAARGTTAATDDGWLMFSAMMLFFAGGWNVIEGLVAFFRSTWFIGHAVWGDLWFWALLWGVFGLFEIGAGYAIVEGRGWGRWFGIVTAGLSAYTAMLAFATYPWWSLIILAVDLMIIFSLAARWHRVKA